MATHWFVTKIITIVPDSGFVFIYIALGIKIIKWKNKVIIFFLWFLYIIMESWKYENIYINLKWQYSGKFFFHQ